MKQKYRVVCLCVLFLVFVGCLSSCSTSGKKATEKSLPKAVYKHDEFTFDGGIKWNSSYSDIVKKYGKPRTIHHEDERLCLWYNNPQVVGYEFQHRLIWLDRNTGRIKSIILSSPSYGIQALKSEDGLNVYNEVKNALVFKYGEPTDIIKDTDADVLVWENVYAETRVSLHVTDNITISYVNTHDYSNEEKYKDIPTITPVPTVVPTPMPNTQGI